jgi:prepilin-type N-terminal cleavage/methylation domain-containing protein
VTPATANPTHPPPNRRPKAARAGGRARGRAAGFTLLEVLLVIGLLAVLLTLMAGLMMNVRQGIREGDKRARLALSVRTAMDRLSADLKAALYYGPTSRFGVGLVGVSGDSPGGDAGGGGGGLDGDRVSMVIATHGWPRGVAEELDDATQPGRADFKVVTWELQAADDGRVRLVRMEQSVLDAVDNGEVFIEVILDDVRRFHLQYYGQAPANAGGVTGGSLTDGVGAFQWAHDWRCGLDPSSQISAAQDSAAADPTAAAGAAAAAATGAVDPTAIAKDLASAPAYGLPAAVQIVIVANDPDRNADAANADGNANANGNSRGGDPDDPGAFWFETIVSLPGFAPVIPPADESGAGTGGGIRGLPGGGR